jgi:hypothetical protein
MFDSGTTPAKIQAVMRRIAFRAYGPNLNTTTRQVRFVVSDGAVGGISKPAFKPVEVVPKS